MTACMFSSNTNAYHMRQCLKHACVCFCIRNLMQFICISLATLAMSFLMRDTNGTMSKESFVILSHPAGSVVSLIINFDLFVVWRHLTMIC